MLAGRDLDDMSYKDLLLLIENTLTIAVVALMRRSGPCFSVIRDRIHAKGGIDGSRSDLSYLWGSTFLFLLLSVAIWQAIAMLNEPVAYVTGTTGKSDFWPDNLEYAMKDVIARLPITLGPLLLTIYLWRRSFKAAPPLDDYRLDIFSVRGLLDNFTTYGRILLWCIPFGMLLSCLVLLYDYAIYAIGPNLDGHYFERKLLVLFLQSLIPLPACYALILTLETGKAGRGGHLWRASLFVAVCVALTAFIYAKTHLQTDLLMRYPEYATADYLLLTIFASTTMFVGAFLCIAIYVYRQTTSRAQIAPATVEIPASSP